MKRSLQVHIRQLVAAAAASALAFGLSAVFDQLLYERWVVPILATVSSVPLYLWAATIAPGFGMIFGAAIIARSWTGLAVAAVSGGVARHLARTWFAEQGRPGTFKSDALEDPDHWWTTHLAHSVVGAAVCLAFAALLLRLANYVWRQRHALFASR